MLEMPSWQTDTDRAFNERVARVVFGPPSQYVSWWWFNTTGIPLDENAALYAGPDFLHSGEAMLLVIERMRALGWGYRLFHLLEGAHQAEFGRHHSPYDGAYQFVECSASLPHAVALAALAAMGGGE